MFYDGSFNRKFSCSILFFVTSAYLVHFFFVIDVCLFDFTLLSNITMALSWYCHWCRCLQHQPVALEVRHKLGSSVITMSNCFDTMTSDVNFALQWHHRYCLGGPIDRICLFSTLIPILFIILRAYQSEKVSKVHLLTVSPC